MPVTIPCLRLLMANHRRSHLPKMGAPYHCRAGSLLDRRDLAPDFLGDLPVTFIALHLLSMPPHAPRKLGGVSRNLTVAL